MGIVESRILAKTLLTACDQAEKEGKRQLDEARLWQDTVSWALMNYRASNLTHEGNSQDIEKHLQIYPADHPSHSSSTRY